MEDTIEICSGCGKMPRAIDSASGVFVCSRSGNRNRIQVSTDNYEKIVTELDQRFHQNIQKTRIEAAASAPVEFKSKKAMPKPPAKKKPAVKKSKKK